LCVVAISLPVLVFGLLVFAFGTVVGSFLNVCIWRIPRGLSVTRPLRSLCPHCGRPIRSWDNVPLLSFLMLRGRCRDCAAPISWRYPFVEGLTGLLFLGLSVLQRDSGPGQVIVMGLVVCLLIVASGVDIEFSIIPDELSAFGLIGGLLAGLLLPQLHVGDQPYHTFRTLTGTYHLDGLIGSAIGAAAGGALVLLFALVGALIFRKEAIGMGDAKLMAVVGAFLGWKVAVLSFFLSPFFGLLYGVPLLLFKERHVMPFGPFLSVGAVLVILMRPVACGYLNAYLDLVMEIVRLLAHP